jgi:predicted acylesterase/phospholipase RssA
MVNIAATGPRSTRTTPKVGLALGGGGPVGAIYELGVLRALEDSIEGLDLNELDIYIGVSAGGFAAAGLANGFRPTELYRIFINSDSRELPFKPSLFLRPALAEYFRRVLALPQLFAGAAWRYASGFGRRGLLDSFQRLSRAIPTGIFDNVHIERFLAHAFSKAGRTNDFRELKSRLFIVATELDTGTVVEFGNEGFDHVPISTAVTASTALPGLFPPVEIEGRYYVDGALRRTLHASVALDNEASLVICVNPLVPFDAALAARTGRARHASLVEGGFPVVLAQTFRAMIQSRMQVGMAKYGSEFPHADVVLFEPKRDDEEIFFTNIFSYSSRQRICEHAYQMTRSDLLARRHHLAPLLAKHGLHLRLDVLRDPTWQVSGAPRLESEIVPAVLARREIRPVLSETLDDLEHWLQTAR